MKKLLELFEKLVGISKRTSDPKIINELQTLATKIENLSVNPSLDSLSQTEQIKAVAEDLLKLETKAIDQIDSGISKIDELEKAYGKGEGAASLDISDNQRQINQIIKKGDSYDEPATLAYTEKKIDPNDPNYFVKTAEEARIQVEQEAKSLFDNGVFTKEQYLDELGRIKEEYGEGSSLYISSQKADGTYEAPSVTNRPQGKSANMYKSAERSIQFVAEKTGLSFEEARLAIMEKMNDGYAIGDPKRTMAKDLDRIKAYLDVNLDYGATDAIQFLEDIEEIAFSGSIDLASDTAKNVSKQNAKQIIDSSNPGEEFGETLIDFDDAVNKTNVLDVLDNPKTFTEIQQERGVGQFADDAPKTIEDTFKNVPPERRAVMEELYAPVIEEQKIIEATQAEIQQTTAKIQDLARQGKFEEAEALNEALQDFQRKLKSGNNTDATIIPPKRTLNANGGRIGFDVGGSFNVNVNEDDYVMSGSLNDISLTDDVDLSLGFDNYTGEDLNKTATINYNNEIETINGLELNGFLSKTESEEKRYLAEIKFEKEIADGINLNANLFTDGNIQGGNLGVNKSFGNGLNLSANAYANDNSSGGNLGITKYFANGGSTGISSLFKRR